jgi:hypothetical protein
VSEYGELHLICERGHHSTNVPQHETCTAPIHPDGKFCIHVEGPCWQGAPCGAEIVEVTVDVDEFFSLRALVVDLGRHLTALCNHPANWEHRYETEGGYPCPGCYDARDEYLAHLPAPLPPEETE